MPRKKTGTTPASPGRQRVMNGYRELKKKIAQRVAILSEVIQEMESREVVETVACERWKDHLNPGFVFSGRSPVADRRGGHG